MAAPAADRPAPREAQPAACACACGEQGAKLTWDPYIGRARCRACQRLVVPSGLVAFLGHGWPPATIDLCPREPDGLVPHTRAGG